MKRIFFLMVLTIGFIEASGSYSRSDDIGIVTDSATELTWQDNNISVEMGWQNAIDTCEALNLGEDSNWRLPSIIELETLLIVDRAKPMVNDSFQNIALTGANTSIYWSSTSLEGVKTSAWVVDFRKNHSVYGNDKVATSHFVRCVRDAKEDELP